MAAKRAAEGSTPLKRACTKTAPSNLGVPAANTAAVHPTAAGLVWLAFRTAACKLLPNQGATIGQDPHNTGRGVQKVEAQDGRGVGRAFWLRSCFVQSAFQFFPTHLRIAALDPDDYAKHMQQAGECEVTVTRCHLPLRLVHI